MKTRTLILGIAAVVLVGFAIYKTGPWAWRGAEAQAPAAVRVVPVEVATAVRRPAPVFIEALGNVSPIETVAVRSRVDSEIIAVHFRDGATVKKGDLLFSLDSRATEAQIAQAEGNVAKDIAQLEGALRDVRRYTELVAKNATPVVNLENAQTQADTFRAAIKADQGALENLKVLLTYCTIRAPIAGQISAAAVKVGNFVRATDVAPLATINQIAPIYVSFAVPQRNLPDVRAALAAETASVEAIVAGERRRPTGLLSMIENTVDPTTGMITMRATFDNADQVLWPGALATMRLTLRYEDGIVVPTSAVLTGQAGTYVYVLKDNVANVQRVTVARNNENETVISEGLSGGETVVVNGHLLLNNGTKVSPREAKAGS
ncbi:MAG: efflux RND transporter periplasmic adaptor subunit [Hyphomicrobiales bacterium]|nr:efflux RND transporter periplasmic adaptor subunit [Hyphomicrobiales bacterium]MBV9428770.1 efflux RND transporter periplasmic adaptor subunit [Bradyrhizobiaceae bacterium]